MQLLTRSDILILCVVLPYAEAPLIDILGSLATLGFAIRLIVRATLCRAGLLMYGKRPSPRDIWRFLKES
jgi:hypothetical protein